MTTELQNAIKIALANCKNPFALAYLKAIDQSIALDPSNGLKTQLLYCLSNMTGWKGEQARLVKKVFNQFIKSN